MTLILNKLRRVYSSGVAKLRHNRSRALAIKGSAHHLHLEARLKIIGAESTFVDRESGAKDA